MKMKTILFEVFAN